MWTQFHDMSSGGTTKLDPIKYIYIESSSQEEAIEIFQSRFNRNPFHITCPCCGEDYSINSHENILQLTGFERGCRNLKVPRNERGLYLNNLPEIQNSFYLEENEEPPKGFEVQDRQFREEYQTLEQYKRNEDVIFLYKEDIILI